MADRTMAPEWRQCKRFPDYEVSDTGLVRKGKRMLKPQVHPWGYTLIYITAKPKQLKVYVHRLVAETFLGEGTPGYEVDHINNDKTDNRVGNLRWLSIASNRRLRRQRNTGPTAQELQRAGKLSALALHMGTHPVFVENGDNPANQMIDIEGNCGQIYPQIQLPHKI